MKRWWWVHVRLEHASGRHQREARRRRKVDEENEDEVRWWEKEIWGEPGSHRIAFLEGISARAQWGLLFCCAFRASLQG